MNAPSRASQGELSTVLNIRMSPKDRWLLEVASKITGLGNSEMVRAALTAYFDTISPHRVDDFIAPTPGFAPATLTEREQLVKEAEAKLREKSLARLANLLWMEHANMRLQMLAAIYPHLLTDNDWKLLKEK